MNRFFFSLALIFCSTKLIFSQTTITPAGGDIFGSDGSVSFTIGQVDYNSYSSNEHEISEGVQQPYEIFIVTSADGISPTDIRMIAYPNPADEYLVISLDETFYENVSYRLYDLNGKLLKENAILSGKTVLQMSNLPSATYFLTVISVEKNASITELKSFKIIKR